MVVQWWYSDGAAVLSLQSAHCALTLLNLLSPRTRQEPISLTLLGSGGAVVVQWWHNGCAMVVQQWCNSGAAVVPQW